MRIYHQSFNLEIWQIVESACTLSTTPVGQWTNEEKKSMQTNAKAMNALFCALERNEFNRVSNCQTAHEIWYILEVTHEGTTRVKESKISVLVHKFELFSMNEGESIKDMYHYKKRPNLRLNISDRNFSHKCPTEFVTELTKQIVDFL